MRVLNRLGFAACLWLIFATLAVFGQLNSAPTTDACVAKDEIIYGPDEKRVKPPRLDTPPAEQMPEKVKGQFILEIVVNSDGRLCEVHLKKASDKAAGMQLAAHIAEHWKFKPATLDGKAVAVKIIVNCNLGH
jgi:TonB family protein